MPGYEHEIVCYPAQGFAPLIEADIVVCPDPRILRCLPVGPVIVQHLNAIKLFPGEFDK